MNLLSLFSALLISFTGWMYNPFQVKDGSNNDKVIINAVVLKITVDQKNIKVRNGIVEVKGNIVNLSDKDTVKYQTWISFSYFDKSANETKNVSQTSIDNDKISGNVLLPLGEDSFKVSTSGLSISGSDTKLSGEGTMLIFASPGFTPGTENALSNIIKIQVNFDTDKSSIVED